MLICDLCGGKDNVSSARLEFDIRRVDQDPIGTMYTQDVCQNCYTKIDKMIHAHKDSLTLGGVLSKGLDLKPNNFREAMKLPHEPKREFN